MGLEPFLFRAEDARLLAEAANPDRPLQVHIKVDSGMARLGCILEEALEITTIVDKAPGLALIGLASHLACADQPERPENRMQIERFSEMVAHPALSGRGLRRSLANSGGLLGLPESHHHWGRPGIMLYGASPFFPFLSQRRAHEDNLRPVARWKSHIVQIQHLEAGTSIGYGHTFTTMRPSRIAQLPVGYADGVSRLLGGGRGHVALHGRRAPMVGVVCMDLISIDITDIDEAAIGSEAILLGGGDQGGVEPTLEGMAATLGTIPYEVLCRLGPRLPRIYI